MVAFSQCFVISVCEIFECSQAIIFENIHYLNTYAVQEVTKMRIYILIFLIWKRYTVIGSRPKNL